MERQFICYSINALTMYQLLIAIILQFKQESIFNNCLSSDVALKQTLLEISNSLQNLFLSRMLLVDPFLFITKCVTYAIAIPILLSIITVSFANANNTILKEISVGQIKPQGT